MTTRPLFGNPNQFGDPLTDPTPAHHAWSHFEKGRDEIPFWDSLIDTIRDFLSIGTAGFAAFETSLDALGLEAGGAGANVGYWPSHPTDPTPDHHWWMHVPGGIDEIPWLVRLFAAIAKIRKADGTTASFTIFQSDLVDLGLTS